MTRSTKIIWKRGNEVAAGVLLLLVAWLGTPAAAQTPSQVVDALANQVIAVLKDGHLDTAQKRSQVEQIAYGAIDFATLSKLVLARNWPKFSPPQREAFEQEFRQHLSMTYGRNVDNYKNEKVDILGERPEQRGDVTVQTKIVRGGGGSEDVVVDYRLRQDAGQWKIIDVIIEGVSLVSNFRSQFQDIVANGGPDRLLALLKEKNAAGEPLQKP
ncbi:MAG: ABC transporter substrate-binding protein [Candidatus Binatia bacterium]